MGTNARKEKIGVCPIFVFSVFFCGSDFFFLPVLWLLLRNWIFRLTSRILGGTCSLFATSTPPGARLGAR